MAAAGSGSQAYAGAVFKVVMSAIPTVEVGSMCNVIAQVEVVEAMGSMCSGMCRWQS